MLFAIVFAFFTCASCAVLSLDGLGIELLDDTEYKFILKALMPEIRSPQDLEQATALVLEYEGLNPPEEIRWRIGRGLSENAKLYLAQQIFWKVGSPFIPMARYVRFDLKWLRSHGLLKNIPNLTLNQLVGLRLFQAKLTRWLSVEWMARFPEKSLDRLAWSTILSLNDAVWEEGGSAFRQAVAKRWGASEELVQLAFDAYLASVESGEGKILGILVNFDPKLLFLRVVKPLMKADIKLEVLFSFELIYHVAWVLARQYGASGGLILRFWLTAVPPAYFDELVSRESDSIEAMFLAAIEELADGGDVDEYEFLSLVPACLLRINSIDISQVSNESLLDLINILPAGVLKWQDEVRGRLEKGDIDDWDLASLASRLSDSGEDQAVKDYAIKMYRLTFDMLSWQAKFIAKVALQSSGMLRELALADSSDATNLAIVNEAELLKFGLSAGYYEFLLVMIPKLANCFQVRPMADILGSLINDMTDKQPIINMLFKIKNCHRFAELRKALITGYIRAVEDNEAILDEAFVQQINEIE